MPAFLFIHLTQKDMSTQHRSDPGGIKSETTDQQRTLASQGGPATGLGDPANRQVPSPATDDLQTQAAAKGAQAKKDTEDVEGEGGLDEPTRESQTHSRGNNGRGSNH
jgi:hypothetical protein